MLSLDNLEPIAKKMGVDLEETIINLKQGGIPVVAHYSGNISQKNYPLRDDITVKKLAQLGIDGFSLETFVDDEQVFDTIQEISKLSSKHELEVENHIIQNYDIESEQIIRDYIVYNAYRVTKELDVKSIVCFTENGFTPPKLVSFSPRIPIIAFTKNEEVYRFLNIVR